MDYNLKSWPSLPFLTEPDVKSESEGSIDPLGMGPIAERLASALVPGVRERHLHPRFLTTIVVGLRVCETVLEDTFAADGRSPPHQVYEWYVVEGMVRTAEWSGQPEAIRGLPGQNKARAALSRGVPLSAATYLKTPSVFGLHGVYRRLGENLGLLDEGGLRESGADLLEIWSQEQRLQGFGTSRSTANGRIHRDLFAAVQDGLDKGEIARGPRWGRWSFFFDHLKPLEPGDRESEAIWRALMTPPDEPRAQVLGFLASDAGVEGLEDADRDGGLSERIFHRYLRRHAEPEMAKLLDAIDAYERFCRLIHNAFYDCLAHSALYPHPVSLDELAETSGVKTALKHVRRDFNTAIELLDSHGEAAAFREVFGTLTEPSKAVDFTASLLEHHRITQRRKPPNGKAPWLEQCTDGRVMVRPRYRDRKAGTDPDRYVGLYRTNSLQSFAADLGRLPT